VKPIFMNFSQASITMRSIISSAAGMMPAPMISPTASAAWRTLGNTASSVSVRSGSGTSFTVTRVITPRLPSLPVRRARMSKPGASSASPPATSTSPSASTARTDIRLWVVRPYLRQCTPPEFSATLPPMEQIDWLEGSGA
jgi:hypothetical protein